MKNGILKNLNGRFLLLLLELGALVAVINIFGLEAERGFATLSLLILGGFLIHSNLPIQWRPGFFLALSLFAILFIAGIEAGLIVILLGFIIIGICHLPVSFGVRVGVLLLTAAALAVARNQVSSDSWSIVWPLFASIFMFRTVVYMYDIRNETAGVPLSQRLSYFFLLPNACFPLFPVIDYTSYKNSFYSDKDYEIYQDGTRWMCQGVIQLLMYRLIYQWGTLPPYEVQDVGALAQFMVSNYGLYLRVSGTFHIISGVLCLFGHHLPRTHQNYFLASSFNDFWRRINIYWKNFMMKIFFYPVFMRLRRFGFTIALVVATIVVFISTWLLHSYQWYWLFGAFPLTVHDGIFWGVLGVLVVINSVYEEKKGKAANIDSKSKGVVPSFLLSLRVLGMFIFMSILWSLWTSGGGLDEWLTLWQFDPHDGMNGAWILASVLLALLFVGTLSHWLIQCDTPKRSSATGTLAPFRRYAMLSLLIIVAVLGFSTSRVGDVSRTAYVIDRLKSNALNDWDRERQVRGYYEDILGETKGGDPLIDARLMTPKYWGTIEDVNAVDYTDDFFVWDLKPNLSITYKKAEMSTNQWGMRDKFYSKVVPESAYRMAMVGGSVLMGSGLEDDEPFEHLIEQRINRDLEGSPEIEIMNFGIAGHMPFQRLMILDRTVFDFDPDAIVYVAHWNDIEFSIDRIVSSIEYETHIPFTYLQEVIEATGIEQDMHPMLIRKKLERYGDELIRWVYQNFVEECRKRGVQPVWAYVEMPDEGEGYERLKKIALESGFTAISAKSIYSEHAIWDVMLAPWDNHPNALANRLIADSLYEQLVEPGVLEGL